MSIFQDALNTIQGDLKILADKTAAAILHSDLSHEDYANNKGKFQSIGFVFNLVKTVGDWINDNPDAQSVPASFLNNTDESEPSQDAPEVHTVSVDSSEGE